MKKRNGFRQSLHGFTLVELLVVIGIIALLISMLLPTLNKAVDSARRISCASDMRQIYTSIVMYTQAYKGYLPGPSYSTVGIPQGFPGGKYPDGSSTGYSYYSLAGALIGASHILPEGSYALFGCPGVSFPDVIPTTVQRYVNTSTYKVDGGVAPGAPSSSYALGSPGFEQYVLIPFGYAALPPYRPRKITELSRFGASTSDIWLVYDTAPWHGSYSGTQWTVNGVTVPVGKLSNYLLADGHVESLPSDVWSHWWSR